MGFFLERSLCPSLLPSPPALLSLSGLFYALTSLSLSTCLSLVSRPPLLFSLSLAKVSRLVSPNRAPIRCPIPSTAQRRRGGPKSHRVQTCTSVHRHRCTDVYICTHICAYICVYRCTHLYICVCVQVYASVHLSVKYTSVQAAATEWVRLL